MVEYDQYSFSQIRQFLNCQNQWYLRYVERIKKVEIKRPPTLGSAVHEGIAARIKGVDAQFRIDAYMENLREELQPYMEMNPHLIEDWEVVSGEVETHAMRLVDMWTKWIELDQWETVVHSEYGPMVERRMVEGCYDPVSDYNFNMVWIADWVAKHKKTGLTWVIDWKSKTQFAPESHHEFNLQKMMYQLLLWENDIEVCGSRIAQILSKAPSYPKVNKDGSMSRAACATTWEIYENELLKNGLNPEDYADMRGKLKTADDWFNWQYAYRRIEECQNAWASVILPTIRAMKKVRENGEPIRNLGSLTCTQMCSMGLVCMETLRGSKLEDMIGFGYTQEV